MFSTVCSGIAHNTHLPQSNLSVTVEVEDVNSRPYFDGVKTDIALTEVRIHPDYVQPHIICAHVCMCVCVGGDDR